ncbi:recombinase family protein [Kushneria konosiri]|uniref:Resolvase n=1 Tax=Kushneria konosiri TaxID=698828 RepID=A0A2Z2H860_9GAMM|nr:recombinase family protein [Kushneria konosiri]ARS53524.1 resolvase [Kushneria konosiri]
MGKIARIYMRVSDESQSLERQERLITDAQEAGYYIAAIYREKASGARADRPELQRMISDLQSGDLVIAERIDRISRLPLPQAQALIDVIHAKGARLSIPGILDFSDLVAESEGITKIVLESVQEMLLKLALQMARDDYEERRRRQLEGISLAKKKGLFTGRRPDKVLHERIRTLRSANFSIAETARIAGCSEASVKRVWSKHKNSH